MKTQPLRMEFASQGRRVPLPGLLAAGISALILAWVALQMVDAMAERARQQQTLKRIADESQAPPVQAKALEKPDPKDVARALFARQTVRNLNTPWTDLLAGLEKAPNNVALLVLEPSAAKRSLSITAEAASPTQMLDYLAALQADGRFANVALVSHQLQAQAPGTPLRFQLRASWGEVP
ncbi:hypothetical protein [Hydrogenophaga sp. PAMC20947]|uniref:hypothetical protein n=1 Tax=Hydrogenophaga sp. PAMC20947 TaxID=2565558 RepID=UPI00109E116B|nr:hypothetical protein [Hydrogenophaga sp. PAMC20947]QCB45683.1 hypothetical protein E5678_06400 [Hydrogenophaga sp. PAMC20947]